MDNVSKNVRYGYLRVKAGGQTAYVCGALVKERDSNNYLVGFSFYSPREIREFSKEMARKIALNRCMREYLEDSEEKKKRDPKFVINATFQPKTNDSKFRTTEAFLDALSQLIAKGMEHPGNNEVPRWLITAAKRGNVWLGLTQDKSRLRPLKFINQRLVDQKLFKDTESTVQSMSAA